MIDLHRVDMLSPGDGLRVGMPDNLVIISPLDTVERTVSRFEPGSSALAKHVPLESMPDALADALGLMSAEAIPAGSLAVFVCRRSKAIQCEGVFLIQEAKNSAALRIGLVHLDRYTPSGILPHSLQMSQGFSKRRVVEISGKVEGILQTPAGRIVSHEWQFEQKCLGSFRHARHYRKKSRSRILLLNEFRGLLRLYLSKKTT
jgi:hypothetical protein